MSIRESTYEYRLRSWTKLIQERESSGLSIKAYCESIGMAEHSYYHRLRKVREAACVELTRLESSKTDVSATMFTEVKLPETAGTQTLSIIDQSQLCIETSGLRLTAGSEYPIAKLLKLMQSVRQSCY